MAAIMHKTILASQIIPNRAKPTSMSIKAPAIHCAINTVIWKFSASLAWSAMYGLSSFLTAHIIKAGIKENTVPARWVTVAMFLSSLLGVLISVVMVAPYC